MLKQFVLALAVGGFALVACAADNGPAAVTPVPAPTAVLGSGVDGNALKLVQQSLLRLAPGVQVDVVTRAPIPGFYQVIASGQMVYVSTDGKYLMSGDLVDLGARKSLNDAAWAAYRKAELAKLPAGAHVSYAPARPKYRVTVFTDITCPYCKALHEHIEAYNKAGIAVDYLAWPRAGVTDQAGRPTPSYLAMVSAWCAADPRAALTRAFDGHEPKPAKCANPVRAEFELGEKLGVSGTPAIFTPNGRQIGGYLTPAQLIKALEEGG